MAEVRRFLIVMDLENSTASRLQETVPRFLKLLEEISVEAPVQQAFHSTARDIFGYVIRSKMNAAQIHASIETPQRKSHFVSGFVEPFLFHNDNVLVLEIGDDFYFSGGMSRLGAWLQHH